MSTMNVDMLDCENDAPTCQHYYNTTIHSCSFHQKQRKYYTTGGKGHNTYTKNESRSCMNELGKFHRPLSK